MPVNWGSGSDNPDNKTLDCGSFYPGITREMFFDAYRAPLTLPLSTVDLHLRQGIITVRRALASWKEEQEVLEINRLVDVPQELVDGVGELSVLWQRAVYCEAKAELLKETQTVDRRAEAENAAKSGEETEDKFREFAQDAIRTIIGMGRISVELI